jgi:hypothetical protein
MPSVRGYNFKIDTSDKINKKIPHPAGFFVKIKSGLMAPISISSGNIG